MCERRIRMQGINLDPEAERARAKEERIRRSLEALYAPSLINLTLEQWKEILEEAEEEEEDET
jgi:hypothetical protein